MKNSRASLSLISHEDTSTTDLSLRDPDGHLVDVEGRLIRVVNQRAAHRLETILRSPSIRRFISEGRFIETWKVSAREESALLKKICRNTEIERSEIGGLWEHKRLPFVSYPHEWSPQMLLESAQLTIDLAEALLSEDLQLKDATPYNILLNQGQPVFVDILSIEPRANKEALWIPTSQFFQMFFNPLLANKFFKLPLKTVFSTHMDGLAPEEVYSLLGPIQRFSPAFFTTITLPTWFTNWTKKKPTARISHQVQDAQAKYILSSLFKRLRRLTSSVSPISSLVEEVDWYHTKTESSPYTDKQLEQKIAFVKNALTEFSPKRVLDIGCNVGSYSKLAAEAGASVVALDISPEAISALWQNAKAKNLDILPLLVDISNPSPGVGWRNREHTSFLDRAQGNFDTVFTLAILHHILVTHGIPIHEIIDLMSSLTNRVWIAEFVSPKDSMFTTLAKGRNCFDIDRDHFEAQCQKRFKIVRRQPLEGTERTLYCLKKLKPNA
jgi:2-polyprenyl-3-methyl-5-hydroxy-6-metoxy-1,4-benzoquinol methylase